MGADGRSDGRHVELYSERNARSCGSFVLLFENEIKRNVTPKKNETKIPMYRQHRRHADFVTDSFLDSCVIDN